MVKPISLTGVYNIKNRMMKKYLIVLALLSTVVSCQKTELEEPQSLVEQNLTTINITAGTDVDYSDTKTSITGGNETWDFKWTEGDKLGGHSFTYDDLSGWDTTIYPFTMTTDLSNGDAEYAEFTGAINSAKEQQRFIHPYINVKCSGGMPYLSIASQTVDLTDPLANLHNYMYMVSDKIYDTASVDFSDITMKHICAVLDLNLTFSNIPDGTKIKNVKVKGVGDTKLNFYIQFDFKEEYQTEFSSVSKTLGGNFADVSSNGLTREATVTIENSPELKEDETYEIPIAMYPVRFYSSDRADDFLSVTVTFTSDDNEEEQEREYKKNWGGKSGYYSDVMRGEVQPINLDCDLAEPDLPDFTDPDGTFFLFEGNMSDSWGKVVYIDKDGGEWNDIFYQQNGVSVGNVLQDMYIYNDKIYFLTQNGNLMGHGGSASENGCDRLVVCDAKTMKILYHDALEFTDPGTNLDTWPQHIVVADDDTAYIQFSTHMETHSGVYKLELSDEEKTVTNKGIISDTYGEFTTTGATKARMTLSNGKIFMGRGASFISIDTATDNVTVIETFTGKQVKDVAKAGDGNIYVAVSGEGTSEGEQASGYTNTMTSAASIVCYNQEGVKAATSKIELSSFDSKYGFPIDTPSPNIGMCASFGALPAVYFRDQPQFVCPTIGSIDYSYGIQYAWFSSNTIGTSTTDPVYGYMGVHPTTNKLYVGYSTNAYTQGKFEVWEYASYSWSNSKTYTYSDSDHASPAGVDFAYRFTEEWINK